MSTKLTPLSNTLYCTMIMSSIMAMSSSNWLLMWAALEINMLSFIPLMNLSNKFQETEAMLKYFLAQALGSSILLMTSSSMWNTNSLKPVMMLMLLSSMLIKLGMVPYHFWFPSVMSSISWLSCTILSTWQKLAPLSILTFLMYKTNIMLMYMICGLNALIGSTLGMNQTKLKSIMAASSITHMGWMYSLSIINKPMLSMMYLLLYSSIIIPMFMMFNKLMMNSPINNSMFSHSNMMTTTILLLSLGGLPPLMGFFPKLMSIWMMSNHVSLMLILIIGALINLYFYLNILFMLLMNNMNNKNLYSFKSSNYQLMIASLTLPIIILLI